jgi:uncharacterized protein YdeI (YjbR/CyaY-like superfamily)
MEPIFFDSAAAFRDWLDANHEREPAVLVGFHKRHTNRPSLTWSESVDQALCFGWIDGIRRSIDGEAYAIRFTHRKPGSVWSAVNIKKVEELTKAGLMRPAGLEAFEARDEEKSRIYSYEQRHTAALDPDEARMFRRNHKAWKFFEAQARGYRQTVIYWVTSARQASTRQRRLAQLIEDSAQSRRLGQLDRYRLGGGQRSR